MYSDRERSLGTAGGAHGHRVVAILPPEASVVPVYPRETRATASRVEFSTGER